MQESWKEKAIGILVVLGAFAVIAAFVAGMFSLECVVGGGSCIWTERSEIVYVGPTQETRH